MKKCIVITTINPPTEAIRKFSEMKDWDLILVGDLKTPHDLYKQEDIHALYLSPEYQEQEYPEISQAIGWNTSVRRNIGYIEAYKLGYDIIALSDDDNIPLDNWGKDLLINKPIVANEFKTNNLAFDPLSVTSNSYLWHRGYPIQDISIRERRSFFADENLQAIVPKIQVDLWNGDPDVDAVERLIYNPNVIFEIERPFFSRTISPFDSQNTFLAREMMPYFMLVPGVGRVDDIWGSYLLQMTVKEKNPYIVYSKASVIQKRNEHDLIKDLEQELHGYRYTKDFLNNKYYDIERILKFYKLYQSYFTEAN